VESRSGRACYSEVFFGNRFQIRVAKEIGNDNAVARPLRRGGDGAAGKGDNQYLAPVNQRFPAPA
jgi:hypothetical protein